MSYGTLLLLAPLLGLIAALIATWYALLAGSIWYMPLGLLLVLSAIALIQSHKRSDLLVLGLAVAGVLTVLRMETAQQNRLAEILVGLTSETALMAALLLVMLAALILLRSIRRKSGRH